MMKQVLIVLFLISSFSFYVNGQDSKSFKIHSHNDYLQKAPFWEAYAAGASSIEVDVILKDGQLMAAHEAESINPAKTIQSLYLDPIRAGLKNGLIDEIIFTLLVDLKTEALSTLEVLEKIMLDYQDLSFGKSNPSGLKLIISGNRPTPDSYQDYPEWMLFDYQSKELTKDLPWEKIGMVSLSFRQFSIWNGKGGMVEEQKTSLQEFIDLVHSFEKPVRFWGTPDSKTAWKVFHEMGVDYINTDHPAEAANYLSTLSGFVNKNPNLREVYNLKYEVDGVAIPGILMIGDGNGLVQISSGLFANGNVLNLTELPSSYQSKRQHEDISDQIK